MLRRPRVASAEPRHVSDGAEREWIAPLVRPWGTVQARRVKDTGGEKLGRKDYEAALKKLHVELVKLQLKRLGDTTHFRQDRLVYGIRPIQQESHVRQARQNLLE